MSLDAGDMKGQINILNMELKCYWKTKGRGETFLPLRIKWLNKRQKERNRRSSDTKDLK